VETDRSWTSLLKPGLATEYFTVAARARLLGDTVSRFSVSDAWWLAELSRLVYRADRPVAGPTRQAVLREHEMEERVFVDGADGRCALIGMSASGRDAGAVLVVCGTRGIRNGLSDLDAPLVAWRGPGRVHRGFHKIFEKMWPMLEGPLASVMGPLYYTGHSMGGAVAAMLAAWRLPDALYTFGAPRVGDPAFAAALRSVPTFRVVNGKDIVTSLPPPFPALPYVHAGSLHHIGMRAAGVDEPEGLSTPTAMFARWLTWTRPPALLADHAPVNYVARLEERLEHSE